MAFVENPDYYTDPGYDPFDPRDQDEPAESEITDDDIVRDAIGRYPECGYGSVALGLNWMFQLTRVVNLWRNLECYLAGDPPKQVVEGYPGYKRDKTI